MDSKRSIHVSLWWAAALLLISAFKVNIQSIPSASSSYDSQVTKEKESFLPEEDEFRGWRHNETVSHYNRESLYGYINGGAEIFLQYDFQHLTQAVYSRDIQGSAQEIVIEIYFMMSALDAFGIFSINRSGGEQISQKIQALNLISPSQVNIFKDHCFVNVLAFDCPAEELEAFASFVADKIPGDSAVPDILNRFPMDARIPGSEKYIKGSLGAASESVLLQAEFWGFEQTSRAYSCRYRPYNSRAILLQFAVMPDSIEQKIETLFKQFLEDVKTESSEITGKNAVGRFFIFICSGKEAGLILGEESLETARSRLNHLLGLDNNQT